MASTMEDIAQLRVKILGDEAERSLDSLKGGLKDVRSELTLMEADNKKGTEVWKEGKLLVRDITKEHKKLAVQIDINNASYNELVANKRQLNSELNKLKIGSAEWLAKMKEIQPVNKKISETRAEVRGLGKDAKSTESAWGSVKKWIIGAFAVQAIIQFGKQIIDFGKQVFDLTGKFEKYDVILKNTLGSQSEAAAAMRMIKEVAATTPISVDEMTDSFIKYVNRGVKPTMEEIKKLADLAASQGKDFDQLTEAVLDAQMGEGERLKEFGIRMRKNGDDISLAFKGQTQHVKNNEKAIYNAIVAMGAYNGVAGMTSEVSKTLEGRVSNLGDAWDFFRVELGNKFKPVFHSVIDLFEGSIEIFKIMLYHIDRLSKIVGIAVTSLIAYQVAIRASAAAAALKNGVMKLQQLLYGQALLAKRALTTATVVETEATLVATTAAKGFNAALKANPIGLIITILTLAVTAYQGYKLAVAESTREMDDLNNKIAESQAPLKMQQEEFNNLAKTVLNGNNPLEDRKTALDELIKLYPDNLKGITDLKTAEKKLSGVIRSTNADFVVRAKLLENEVRLSQNNAAATNAIKEKIKLEKELLDASTRRVTMVTGTAGIAHTYKSEAENIQNLIIAKDKQVQGFLKGNAALAKSSEELLSKLKFQTKEEVEGNKEVTISTAAELTKRADVEKETTEDRSAAEVKANEALIAKLDDIWEENIEDDLERNEVRLLRKFEAEEEAIENSVAAESVKTELLKALREKLIEDIEELDADEEDRKKKDRETQTKLIKEWNKKVTDWTFEHKKEELEELIDAENKNNERRWALREQLLELIYDKELEEIEKWKVDQLAATELTEAQRSDIITEANNRQIAAKKVLNKGLNNLEGDKLEATRVTLAKEEELRQKSVDAAITIFKKLSSVVSDEMDDVEKAVTDGLMTFTKSLAKGDYIAALFSIMTGVIDVANAKWKEQIAEIEREIERLESRNEARWDKQTDRLAFLNSSLGQLDKLYGELAFPELDFDAELENQLANITQIWDSFDPQKRGTALPYFDLINEETKYAELVLANYETKLAAENNFFNQAISNIQALFDKDMLLNNQAFDAETLAVKENLSQQLLALITNEDSKLSVTAEYAGKRSSIMKTFALADVQITEGMDQSQVDAINASIEARAKALSTLENWYNTELDFIVNSEGQKRKEYSETERLRKEADERIADLALNNQVRQIDLEKTKNADIEAENKRHTDEVTRLGVEKDNALAASFDRLKDLMIVGYEAIRDAAFAAYTQGVITAEKLNEIYATLSQISDLNPQINIPERDLPILPPPPPLHTNGPRMADGGMIPYGPSHNEGGISLWDNKRGTRVGEIEGGEPILSRVTYANNRPLIDALLHSSMHKNGAKIYKDGGHLNYLSGISTGSMTGRDGSGATKSGYYKDGGLAAANPSRIKDFDNSNNAMGEVLQLISLSNEILKSIANKPSGISLHDLNGALYAQFEAERKSDL